MPAIFRHSYIKNAARQWHGFEYEKKIIQKYNMQKTANYTAEYDSMLHNIPIQIKCMKHGTSVEFGDYFRNKQKEKDFILIVGFWKEDKINIKEEYILKVNSQLYTDNLKYYFDEDLRYGLKHISNNVCDDKRWKAYCHLHRQQWQEMDNNLALRFRRDHKTQKRIQCGVSWKMFNEWFRQEFEEISYHDLLDIANVNALTL